MILYHYFESKTGAFKNLSDLKISDATSILASIKADNAVFAAHRYDGYMERRHELERIAKDIFIEKGGRSKRSAPHYMVVEKCDWLETWYTNGRYIKIDIESLDVNTISFSYGDLFLTFSDRFTDGREYRKQVYTYDEILHMIKKYGLPQQWNKGGIHGPERYIEAQVWSNDVENSRIYL